jgi:hypothetical protein
VPAPACLLPTEFTLHYYTSHTPAHSRSERYNQLLTAFLSHSHSLNLSSSSIFRQQSPPPIRSPQIHKPPPTPPCLCSHQPSRKSRLVRVCRLFDSRPERLHRRAIGSTLERLICLPARTAHLTTSILPPCKLDRRRLEELKTSATDPRIARERIGIIKANSSYKRIPVQKLEFYTTSLTHWAAGLLGGYFTYRSITRHLGLSPGLQLHQHVFAYRRTRHHVHSTH